MWDVIDSVRFRGSYSRDIRAPNFRELFYSQTIPAGGFFGSQQPLDRRPSSSAWATC